MFLTELGSVLPVALGLLLVVLQIVETLLDIRKKRDAENE